MRPLRIGVLEPIAHAGGAEISMLELVRSLGGDPQFVVILPEDGPLRAKALAAGAEVRILKWPARVMRAGERAGSSRLQKWLRAALALTAMPGLARRLAVLLDDIGADLLLTNGIKAHVLGAIAQLDSKRPLIWYLRDGLEGRTMSALALRVASVRCHGAIAISRYVEKESRHILSSSTPVNVIYNLVDFARFHQDAAPAGDLVKADGEIWFGIVGAVTPLKGQDLFLEAAAIVAERLPQARFLIIGGNFYRTELSTDFDRRLQALAAGPSLQGRVRFLGPREDIPAILRRLDVLVQPNRLPEALGRSILEAMACGVPVIAADRWGPAELIQDGRTGLLSPVLDVQALVNNMLLLGENAARRAAIGAAAEIWVRNELDPEKILGRARTFFSNWKPRPPRS